MYCVFALLLACFASAQAQGFGSNFDSNFRSCMFCTTIPGENYCCYDVNDNKYCCSAEKYYRGGFMDHQTMVILIAVGAVIVTVLLVCICCCCCSCCPFHKRRRQGAVYNSVVRSGPPAYQSASASYYNSQYPPQHPSNPYLGPNPSAPAYTLPTNQH